MAEIHPSAVVGTDAELADDVVVGPNCYIDSGATIGEGTVLEANVVITGAVNIGKGNRFYPNSTVGSRPQLLALRPDDAIGGISIGDNNTIREQVTINPSMHPGEFTKLGDDNLLMVGVHIGHDCTLEDKIVLTNLCQIGGHCKMETGVWFGGVACVHQFVTIGAWSYAAGMAGVNRDVPPFMIVSGHYPPRIRGVNKRGMKRAGLNEEQQQAIMAAYKKLYRSGTPLLEAAKEMAAEDRHDENVRAILDAIIRSAQHRFGRYLEQFRD